MSEKLLSILCDGHDDSSFGDFNWCLATLLNKHAKNLYILGAEHKVEILVADWGNRELLHKSLDLSQEARKIVKFIVIPPEIIKIHEKDDNTFSPQAINAIARRSKGEYLLLAASGVYITLESMAKLLFCTNQGYINQYSLTESYFQSSTYHIPDGIVSKNPSLEILDANVESVWMSYKHAIINKRDFTGSDMILLMKREMWFESTGLDEKIIHSKEGGIDWHNRLTTKYKWDDLELHGIKMFLLGDYGAKNNADIGNRKGFVSQVGPQPFAPNNPRDWGGNNHSLQLIDGYGLPVDAVSGDSIAASLIKFNITSHKLQSVQDIIETNPIYRDVSNRFPFNPESASGSSNFVVMNKIFNQRRPGLVCEVGSELGATSRYFASFPFVEKVVSIDHWDRSRQEGDKPDVLVCYRNNMYEQFLANSIHNNVAHKIYPIRLNSVESAGYCAKIGLKFDLIYLDGEHATQGVIRDIHNWYPLLAPNGLLCGDDWCGQSEPTNVAGAVMACAQEKNLQVFFHGNFWFVFPKEQMPDNLRNINRPLHCVDIVGAPGM